MRARSFAAAAVAAVTAIGLSGCSGSPSSSLRVVYDGGAGEQTLTFSPDQITCEANQVHGLSISADPQGRMNIALTGDRRGSVGAADSAGLVLFEGTDLMLSSDGNALVVGESPGEVALVAGWTPEDGVDVEPTDAERFPASLSGRILCDEPVSLSR